MKSFKIFHLLLILFKIEIIICTSKCGTDTLKIRPKKLNLTSKVETSSIKSTSSDSYTPIKIGYDFTTLKKPSTMNATIFSDVKSILKETREEFSKILQVQHKDFDLTNKLNEIKYYCDLNTIGADYPNFLIRNDLIIFPMFYSFSEGILAAAAPCIIDENNRPFGGVLYINKKLDFNKVNTKLYMKNLLLHEITHILAFHPNLFSNLNMIEKIYSRSYIISSNALAKAKEHYNCSSIIRIPLENQGGSGSVGSHWESRYMLGDYMISTDYPDQAISDITLGLFEDTGFYKVNYYSGGLFKFGKNKGCEFFSKKCIENEKATFDEFCDTAKEAMCISSRTLKSSCYLVNYNNYLNRNFRYFSDPTKGGFPAADYCPVASEFHEDNYYFSTHCQVGKSQLSEEYNENIGNNSLCFMSSLLPNSSLINQTSLIPICYEVECDTSSKTLIIKIGSEIITCGNDGVPNIPPSFKGDIICPKYSEICSSNDGLICNEMFSCFNELANKNNYNYKTTYYDYEGIVVDNRNNSNNSNQNNNNNNNQNNNNGETDNTNNGNGGNNNGNGRNDGSNNDEDDDNYIEPIRRTESYNIRINLILLAFLLILFIC